MKDIEGNGIVHLSAMRLHTNVLEYLIESYMYIVRKYTNLFVRALESGRKARF
jgi:hypothetical protein